MSEPRWIRFEQRPHPNHATKTMFWNVVAKDGALVLGSVSWYGPWRCYAFTPTIDFVSVFEWRCLRDISDFCRDRTREHRERPAPAQQPEREEGGR